MSLNVLIVDDSETVRAIIGKTLKLANVPLKEVFQASNGQEALEVLKAQWVDLVLTDINMPVMNGVELVNHMNEDETMKGIPVVVVSTDGSATRIEELKAKGIRGYIRKPFTPEQIKEIIVQTLGVSDEQC